MRALNEHRVGTEPAQRARDPHRQERVVERTAAAPVTPREDAEVELCGERAELPRLFDESDVLINNMRRGSPDKVAYEASAAGLPVLASSPTFDELFSSFHFSFERDDPESLAELLIKFSQLGADERRAIGMSLRARVEELHSLEAWADRVVAAAGLA